MNPEKNEPKQSITEINQTEKARDILIEQKDNYELDEIEHELVSRYQPRFLAKGGEHLIYELPEHPDIVIKVAIAPLQKIIDWNINHDQPINSLPTELKPDLQESIKQEADRQQKLKKYFGVDHVPGQKEFLVKIPITENILNSLYEENPPAKTNEAWSVVMIQRRVDALNDSDRLSILSGYAPYGETPKDLINEATEHLVFGKNPEEKIKTERLAEIQTHSNLKILLKRSGNDESLREILKELVEKIICYTEETGEIFDLAGQNNIVLYKKDGRWTYVLVDTQFSNENRMVEKAKAILLKFSEGKKINEQEKHVLLNIFCYVWTINGLAEQVGVKRRINIIPKDARLEEIDLLKIVS